MAQEPLVPDAEETSYPGGIQRSEIRTMQKDLARIQQGLSTGQTSAQEEAPAATLSHMPLPGVGELSPTERLVSSTAQEKTPLHPPPGHGDILFPELHPLAQTQVKPREEKREAKAAEETRMEPPAEKTGLGGAIPRLEPPPALERVLEEEGTPGAAVTVEGSAETPRERVPLPEAKRAVPSLEKILEEGSEEEEEAPGPGRRLLLVGALALVVLVGGGFGAWWFLFGQPAPPPIQPPPPPEVEIPLPPLPASLIQVEETKTVPVNNTEQAQEALQRAFGLAQPENRMIRFLVLVEETPQRYLGAQELARAAGIVLREEVFDELEPDTAMLFAIDDAQTDLRIGFAARAKNRDTLLGALAVEESFMEEGLAGFLALVHKSAASATPAFQDNTYLGRHIRYLNFPDPSMTIDYTVDERNNVFLLATSRASMYAAIDRLSQ